MELLDVTVVGGGVAGLWLLNRLQSGGYRARLVEQQQLGFGQSRYAQGIIHGGVKYALNGVVNDASEAIAAMPPRWQAARQGVGEIDLRAVEVRAEAQLLWSTATFTSRLAGFFASKLMRGRMSALEPRDAPRLLQHPDFRGQLYRLHEPVLDGGSLLRVLAQPVAAAIRTGVDLKLQPPQQQSGYWYCCDTVTGVEWWSRAVVLTAGEGSGALLQQLGYTEPVMQLRPLQMVVVRGEALDRHLFAHVLGGTPSPRLTVTSHIDHEGQAVWYLGGELAEQGVTRTPAAQMATAQQLLHELLPWWQPTGLEWATLRVNRAEGLRSDGSRPTEPTLFTHGTLLTAWPLKLAFAPLLADRVLAELRRLELAPSGVEVGEREAIQPAVAPLPWQQPPIWAPIGSSDPI